MLQNQKEHYITDITQAEEIQISASTRLHEWSKNVVNVENVEGKLQVSISYLNEMKTVSMFYNSALFQYFLQLVSTIFCSGDILIHAGQVYLQIFDLLFLSIFINLMSEKL